MKRTLLGLVALAGAAACGDSPATAVAPGPLAAFSGPTLSAAPAALTTVFAEQFVRTRGAVDQYSRTISTAEFDGPYTLRVQNGSPDGSNRVSSATVSLNGVPMLTERDFSQQAAGWTFTPTLGSSASLTVSVAGAPGGYVRISIEGTRRAFHVCSGASATGGYETIADAVAATPPGSTILLCTGVHGAESVAIPHALTIAPEPGAAPVVRNVATTAALVLSSSASAGTVSITNVDFMNDNTVRNSSTRAAGGYSIRGIGSALSLVVTGGDFTARPTNNGSIFVTGSPVAVTVDGATFTGGLFGVYTDGVTSASVRNSQLTNIDLFASRLGAATVVMENNTAEACGNVCFVSVGTGSITDNDAVRCGQVACVNLAGSGVVENNRFSNTIQGQTAGGPFHHVVLSSAPGQTRIANNQISGCGFGQCITVTYATSSIVNNTITAYHGDGTRFAIVGSDGSLGDGTTPGAALTVTGNTIMGVGGNPSASTGLQSDFPISFAALSVEGFSTGTFDDNRVQGAFWGISVRKNARATGRGNVFDGLWHGVALWEAGVQATLRGNDFTNVRGRSIEKTTNNSGHDLTCNYWGQATGPTFASIHAGSFTYQPFAATPIAALGTTSCS